MGERAQGRAVGERLLVGYKAVEVAVETAVAVAVVAAFETGLAARVTATAQSVSEHTVHPLISGAAGSFVELFTPAHLDVLVAVLLADTLLNAVQGWAVYRGYAWSAWLMVVTTGLSLPLEVVSIVRHPKASLVLVLLLNLGIVVYFTHRAARAAGRKGPLGVA